MTSRPGFPDNPQFPMGLVDVDDDDETKCTAIISLIQADANRRRDNKDLLVKKSKKSKFKILRQSALSCTSWETKTSSKSRLMLGGSVHIAPQDAQNSVTLEK